MKHTFAVVAYQDSPYLEACLKSLVSQTEKSDIIICTSTPSGYIDSLASKYGVPVHVRQGIKGIGRDWNFAYDEAEGDLVTLAHQDDLYERDYTKTLFEAKKRWPDMSVFSTSSVSLKNGTMVEWGREERVKKLLRIPLRFRFLCAGRLWKRMVFLLGNPLICPSCAYDRKLCGEHPFSERYQFVLDWDLLVRLSGKNGRFICSEKPLIMYRIHSDAATYACIEDHVREKEEAEMFKKLLPEPMAAVIGNLYRRSYEAYTK